MISLLKKLVLWKRARTRLQNPLSEITASMSFRLPNEITDNIIDFLHDDKPQLSICSLVCKAWLPSSRHHLFRRVSLFGDNYRQFALLLGSQTLGLNALEHFIECLCVNMGPEHLAEFNQAHSGRHSFSPVAFAVADIVPQLVGLHALRSIFLSCMGLSDCLAIQLLSKFPLLEEIYIDSTHFTSQPSVLRARDYPKYDVPQRLRTLDLWWCEIPTFANWICSRESQIPSIQVLSLRPVGPYELKVTGYLLRKLGSSLIDLRLDFHNADEYAKHVGLEKNTQLRYISFFNIGKVQGRASGSIKAAPSVLSSISSLHIEEVNFILSQSVKYVLLVLNCSLLESIFERPQFPVLRAIRFFLRSSDMIDGERRIRESFPRMNSQDILVIDDSICR